MTRRIILPLLAAVGVGLAIAAIMLGDRTPEGATTVVNSVESPFATSVAGTGIVEASTENIAIGTPVSGIVTAIAVKWGDRVNSGDLLFKIDVAEGKNQKCRMQRASHQCGESQEINVRDAQHVSVLGQCGDLLVQLAYP